MLKMIAPIVLGLCAGATSALAQTPTHHVSGYAFEEDKWRFVAVHANTPSQRVDAFVAVAKANVAVGDNIVVVAYLRGATDNDPWTAKTWTTTDRADAIKSAKLLLDIDDADDANWGFDGPIGTPDPSMIEPAKDYQNGVMTDDPSYWWIATDPNNDAMVEVFAEWGLKVADIAIEKETTGCGSNEKLTGMAKGIELAMPYVITDETSGMAVASMAAAVAAPAFVCQPAGTPPPPPPVCTPGPVTPWVVTPLVLKWTPPGWVFTDGFSVIATGGRNVTCNYKACNVWMRFQSCTWLRANCTTYTCTQVETTHCCVTTSCTTYVAAPGPYTCPATPSCAGWPPAFPNPFAVPTTCTVVAPWGPPCN